MDSGKDDVRTLEQEIIGLKAKLYDLQLEKNKSEKREAELQVELTTKEEAKLLEVKVLNEKLEESQQNARLWNNAFNNLKQETAAKEEEKKRLEDKEWIRKWEDSELKKKLEEEITRQKAFNAKAQLLIQDLTEKCAKLQNENDDFLKDRQQVSGYLRQLAALIDLQFDAESEDFVSHGYVKTLVDRTKIVLEQKQKLIASGEEFQRNFREFCVSNAGNVMISTDITNVATVDDDAPFLSISAVSGASILTANNELPAPTATSAGLTSTIDATASAQETLDPSSTGMPSGNPTCSKNSGSERPKRTTRQTGKRQRSCCENPTPTKSAKANKNLPAK